MGHQPTPESRFSRDWDRAGLPRTTPHDPRVKGAMDTCYGLPEGWEERYVDVLRDGVPCVERRFVCPVTGFWILPVYEQLLDQGHGEEQA